MNRMRNHTSDYKLTIVVPLYNEEDNVPNLAERLAAYLPKAKCTACVLFVNDGSTDGSLRLIKGECSHRKDFFYISLKRNCGLSAALKAGIDHTYSEYVGYIDADLQTDPEDFNLLLNHIADHELVTGIRADRKDSGFKKLQSKIANSFRRMMTGDGVRDTGCPLKVMHTENARQIPFFSGLHRFLPAMILMQGGRIMQVPVRHYPRMAGVSKYHLWNRLKGPFIDCFAYRWMKKRYISYCVAESNE
ncbi:MAG: glycosyltransferase [Muribaculum sp.]|nr:glycosyltransferase [Muribaculum sp.]